MIYISPLEQFTILYLYINIMNIILDLIFLNICLIYLFILYKNLNLYLNGLIDKISKNFYYFILDIVINQTSKIGIIYYPYLLLIFFFILFSNLIGMLPFSFTITAQSSITFFFAFSFNIGFLLIGLLKYKLKFFMLFIPNGVPLILLPLIIFIEIISYLIRTFSLSIRLFANMMAGHCLLFVISSFVFKLIFMCSIFIFPFIIFLYFLILCLEFAVAFLQAYVFLTLLSIYLNDSLNLNH